MLRTLWHQCQRDTFATVPRHFGSTASVPKCLVAEVSHCRSVRTPQDSGTSSLCQCRVRWLSATSLGSVTNRRRASRRGHRQWSASACSGWQDDGQSALCTLQAPTTCARLCWSPDFWVHVKLFYSIIRIVWPVVPII